MSKENIDYRAIVERIAEMLHGSVTDIPLLTVTAQSYKDRLAKVEGERTALAAENVALKVAISQHAAGFTVCEACGEENVSGNDDVCRVLNEPPATDAFIAEQRAQGVEMLADHLSGLGISASETSVRDFATRLRQGGAA